MSNKKLNDQIYDGDIFFCYMPWTMVYSEVNGTWRTCCHAKEQKDMDVQNTTPEEWMRSDYQNALRNEMLDPNTNFKIIDDVCWRCRKEEKLYGESRRLRKLRSWGKGKNNPYKNDILNAVELYKLTNEFEFDHRILETQVKVFGMDCNLDCHMCHPRHSTTRQKTQLKDNGLSENIYGKKEQVQKYTDYVAKDRSKGQLKHLENLAPYTYNVKIIGGEPLVMKKQYEYLDMLIKTGHAKHINVKYQTNMTKLGYGKHKVIDYIPHFDRFTFTASLDSMGDAIEYCRRRTKWDEVLENIKIVKQFPNVTVNVNAVMGFLSILRFHEFLEWRKDNFHLIEEKISVYALEFPRHFQVKNLPQKIKEDLILKYHEWPDIQAMLKQPAEEYGTEQALQETFEYLLKGDAYYKGTKYEKNLFEVFPELKKYYSPPEIIAKG